MKKIKWFVTMILCAVLFVPFGVKASGLPLDRTDFTTGEIVVNGVSISAPRPSVSGDEGVILLPLRAIAEALGLAVAWDGAERRVIINDDYIIWIGRAVISRDGGQTTQGFGPAPTLIDGRTFVPLSFFNYGMAGYSARIEEGAVLIDTIVGYKWPLSTSTWFDGVRGHELRDIIGWEERGEIQIHNTGGVVIGGSGVSVGEDKFALLRIAVGAEWFAEELLTARLFLKPTQDTETGGAVSLTIVPLGSPWTVSNTSLTEVTELLLPEYAFTVVTDEHGDGWVSADITQMVLMWLSGTFHNNGFALFGAENEGRSVFSISDDAPYIGAEGRYGRRDIRYASHDFVTVSWDELDEDDIGNCLSFVLRDLNMINLNHLEGTYEEVDRIYRADGINAVAEYIAALLETYVANHASSLQISGFRRINGFDAPIDPAVEYRIALRVGIDAGPNVPITERGGFDYHLWAQIPDGRWAQKFSIGYSEIIMGSRADTDPASLAWHQVPDAYWGNPNQMDFYTSDIIYFAVTKDTADFTAHMKQ